MNCIYKKLVKICNFKESRSHIETLSIDRVINKEHFYEKSMQKLCTKTSPIPLFNFGKQTKIDFFLSTQFFFMDKIMKNKRVWN